MILSDMKHPYITVIGNVASGKSTVSKLLAKKLGAKLVKADELYKVNPFFKDAVVDRTRWSLASDIWFLIKRVEMAKKIEKALESKPVVQDSGLLMSWVYTNSRLAQGHMNQSETVLYNTISDTITKNVPKETAVIYLKESVPLLLERIKTRGRDFEIKHHSELYLKGLEQSLTQMVKLLRKRQIPVLEYSQNRDISSDEGKRKYDSFIKHLHQYVPSL